jgi:hypothetical protein
LSPPQTGPVNGSTTASNPSTSSLAHGLNGSGLRTPPISTAFLRIVPRSAPLSPPSR